MNTLHTVDGNDSEGTVLEGMNAHSEVCRILFDKALCGRTHWKNKFEVCLFKGDFKAMDNVIHAYSQAIAFFQGQFPKVTTLNFYVVLEAKGYCC